jgi:hypothetical protein
MARAKVKKGASMEFFQDANKMFRNPAMGIPQTYREFGELIGANEGRSFEVERQYGDRTVLKYKKPKPAGKGFPKGAVVTGFDIENKYLEFG